MVEATRNPWPLRLAIAGAAMLVLGAFLLASQGPAVDEIWDARNVATLETTGEASGVASLEEGCYYAVTIKGANNVEVNLTKIEGSARVSESLENKICASDWAPMSSDDTAFIITDGWKVIEEAEYALDTTCIVDTDCSNDTVYLVHTNPLQYAAFESPGLLLGFATCCMGLLVLPLAGVVLWLSRSKQAATSVVMMNPDGTMSQAQEITPEMMAAFARGENPLQPKVDAPFADTGLGETETFVDGKQSVMSGDLLTTEQVYALMRGDVEEAGKNVADPFADSAPNPKQVVPIKDPNTQTIASWDAGAPDTGQISENTSRPYVQPVKKVEQKPEQNNDWKAWDEV